MHSFCLKNQSIDVSPELIRLQENSERPRKTLNYEHRLNGLTNVLRRPVESAVGSGLSGMNICSNHLSGYYRSEADTKSETASDHACICG